jgi:hypothetical protein
METYQNLAGQDCVAWTDEDGTSHSMLKSAYDEMIAQREDQVI